MTWERPTEPVPVWRFGRIFPPEPGQGWGCLGHHHFWSTCRMQSGKKAATVGAGRIREWIAIGKSKPGHFITYKITESGTSRWQCVASAWWERRHSWMVLDTKHFIKPLKVICYFKRLKNGVLYLYDVCVSFSPKKNIDLFTKPAKKGKDCKSVSTVSELFSNNSPKSLSSLRGSWISLRSLSFGLGACHLRTLTSKGIGLNRLFCKGKNGPWVDSLGYF